MKNTQCSVINTQNILAEINADHKLHKKTLLLHFNKCVLEEISTQHNGFISQYLHTQGNI